MAAVLTELAQPGLRALFLYHIVAKNTSQSSASYRNRILHPTRGHERGRGQTTLLDLQTEDCPNGAGSFPGSQITSWIAGLGRGNRRVFHGDSGGDSSPKVNRISRRRSGQARSDNTLGIIQGNG
ncbi:unnamed protein product [Boreogadus saida]